MPRSRRHPYFGQPGPILKADAGLPPVRQADAMIKVEGLTKTYAGFTAVDDVNFVCQPGR